MPEGVNKLVSRKEIKRKMEKSKFVEAMEKEVAWKETENGQPALNTTFDACLDLFSTIGALRTRSNRDIENKVAKAYAENKLVAMKTIFYARDIEYGLGERRTFRIAFHYLANVYPEDVKLNIPNIATYGRFDDLYELVGTPLEKDAFEYLYSVFAEDCEKIKERKPISLLAKWLKSTNTSSPESRKLGKLTAKYFGFSDKIYRKILARLRKYLDITEVKMSSNNWETIDFNKVPGGAMKKYYKAFQNHQEERFKEYISALNSGSTITVDGKQVEAKINTKKLFPYEILEEYSKGIGVFDLDNRFEYNPTLEAMWNNLKDWIEDKSENTIVIADTSGSMYGRPMATSVGLGIYFAQHNKGAFHNKFMTFSSKPSWINLIEGAPLVNQLACIPSIVDNTNLQAAFDLILDTAIANKLSQADMPKTLVIITDMEFDRCVVDNNYERRAFSWDLGRSSEEDQDRMTFYDTMKAKFESHGYKLPEIVFWNTQARHDTYHTTATVPHVRMVSGQATSVFKSLIDGKTHTPYDFMLEVLNAPRYDLIKVVE